MPDSRSCAKVLMCHILAQSPVIMLQQVKLHLLFALPLPSGHLKQVFQVFYQLMLNSF